MLRGSENLRDHLVRSGDTFHVSYLSEGDCADVKEVVEWLREMVEALERCPDPDAISSSQAVQDLSCKALNGALHHKLSQELFNPWDGGRHLVNKLHLLSEGGLRLLCRMYGLIHTVEDWRDLPYWLQCLECICGQSLSNFMETEDLCRNVLKCGGLEECFKSLLRQPLDQKDAISHICPNMNRLLIAMEVALYAICK